MEETTKRLNQLLKSGLDCIFNASKEEMEKKPDRDKWSKKEIIGHLIDSAINNLQRFTEIQFKEKPYKIKAYDQDQLVKANHYQNADIKELSELWLVLNKQIIFLMKNQSEETLNFTIENSNGTTADLRFLMNDYVDHLEHHLNQITNSSGI
mgnify:CR=1 FL=1